MPFNWKEVQSNWLYGFPISVAQQKIVEAFNTVENRFGLGLFDNYRWFRGTYATTLILDLAKILEENEKGNCELPENGEVVKRIKENNIHLASLVIRLAAHYLRHDLIVEFEPEAYGKKPDLRVKFDGTWIYVEESKLETSNRLKVLNEVMERISSAVETISSNLNVEVFLLKEDLNLKEIKKIANTIRIMSKNPTQPQDLIIADFIRIITYKKGQAKPLVEENRPAQCMDTLSIGGGFERHLHVEMQFSDVRLNKLLKEKKQLSPKESNLVLLDVSIPGNLKEWSKSIEKILDSMQYRRLGAVMLIEEDRFIKSIEMESKMILHPCPLRPLHRDFIELTKSCFQNINYQYSP